MEMELEKAREESTTALKESWKTVEELQNEDARLTQILKDIEERYADFDADNKSSNAHNDADNEGSHDNNNNIGYDGSGRHETDFKSDTEEKKGKNGKKGINYYRYTYKIPRLGRMFSLSTVQSRATDHDSSYSESSFHDVEEVERESHCPKESGSQSCYDQPEDIDYNIALPEHLKGSLRSLLFDFNEQKMEIESKLRQKENALETIQKTTCLQQETIQQLQKQFEELQSPMIPIPVSQLSNVGGNSSLLLGNVDSRCSNSALRDPKAVNDEKKLRHIAELERETQKVFPTLTDTQREHQSLEDQWHEIEELVEAEEKKAFVEVEELKNKLHFEDQRIQQHLREQERQYKAEQDKLKEYRKNLVDHFLPHPASVAEFDASKNEHQEQFITFIMKSFGALRFKEEKLAQILAKRYNEKQTILDVLERLQKIRIAMNKALNVVGENPSEARPHQDPPTFVNDCVSSITMCSADNSTHCCSTLAASESSSSVDLDFEQTIIFHKQMHQTLINLDRQLKQCLHSLYVINDENSLVTSSSTSIFEKAGAEEREEEDNDKVNARAIITSMSQLSVDLLDTTKYIEKYEHEVKSNPGDSGNESKACVDEESISNNSTSSSCRSYETADSDRWADDQGKQESGTRQLTTQSASNHVPCGKGSRSNSHLCRDEVRRKKQGIPVRSEPVAKRNDSITTELNKITKEHEFNRMVLESELHQVYDELLIESKGSKKLLQSLHEKVVNLVDGLHEKEQIVASQKIN